MKKSTLRYISLFVPLTSQCVFNQATGSPCQRCLGDLGSSARVTCILLSSKERRAKRGYSDFKNLNNGLAKIAEELAANTVNLAIKLSSRSLKATVRERPVVDLAHKYQNIAATKTPFLDFDDLLSKVNMYLNKLYNGMGLIDSELERVSFQRFKCRKEKCRECANMRIAVMTILVLGIQSNICSYTNATVVSRLLVLVVRD